MINETWEEYSAKPLFQANDPLSVFSPTDNQDLVFSPLKLRKESTPRQGINTCGANDLFFFDQVDEHDSDHYLLSNKHHANVILPKEYVYPLITTSNFNSDNKSPSKWVLLPYNVSGKPLNWEQIKQSSSLATYLEQHENRLTNRKGIMLNSWIGRGYWWALLGVGAYTFFPFKIVWEAYGKSTFNPTLFSENWQANQSLQAFIPVKTEEEATAILTFLSAGEIQTYLSSLRMQGTMNWAQPGKIKKFITFED